jgi:ABC-2 type transport system permease protein
MGRQSLGLDRTNYGESVLPYDISISYRLKGGRELLRYYDRISLSILSEMLKMDESQAVREAARQAILGEGQGYSPVSNAYVSGQIYVADPFYQSVRQILPGAAERRALLEALAADVAEQSAADRYFPQKAPEAVLLFTTAGENGAERFAYGLSSVPVYVTEAFGRSLALLRAWGAAPEAPVPDVEKIILQAYDPYAGMNVLSKPLSPYFMAYRSKVPVDFALPLDFGRRPEITDPDEIADLLGALQSCYFANDGGFLAAVKLRGEETYIYLYLPYGETPERIRDRFG